MHQQKEMQNKGEKKKESYSAHHLGRHHIKELLEINGAVSVFVDVCDHLIYGLIFCFEA
jgi:hypothetical protein